MNATVNDSVKGEPALSLRGYARHRGVSPSYIHKLLKERVLERNESGLIDPVRADRILAERAQLVSPLVFAEHERRRQRSRKAAPGSIAPAKAAAGSGDDHNADDDECLLDVVACDAALAQQPHAHDEPEVETPIGRMLAAWEVRLARAQADILAQTFAQMRAIVGPDGDGTRLSATLGTCWGKLRALIDDERRQLGDAIGALIADTSHK